MDTTVIANLARDQAVLQADTWLAIATRRVEEAFGPGAAQRSPELVAAYLNALALDSHAMTLLNGLDGHVTDLEAVLAAHRDG